MPESYKLPTPLNTPPAPLGVHWIDVATAAGRMRVTDRRIRQLCGQRWLAVGLARTEVADGRAAWLIREDADAALSRVKFADQLDYDSRELTGTQRQALNERLAILKGWERHVADTIRAGGTKGNATDEYLAIVRDTRGPRITKTTLYDWQSRFQTGGVAALADGRWQPGRKADRAEDPFMDQVKHFWLDLRKPKLSVCFEMTVRLASDRGWAVHSYAACRRFLQTIPLAVVKLRREGEEAYTNDAEPYIERDYSGVASNEIWCGDHHRFDLWVNAGGKLVRPWLTAWQDMRSRKIVGHVIIAGDPNQQSILEAFRRGVLDCGVPSTLYIDNGKDYDSRALNGETKKERRIRRRVGEFDYAAAQGIFARLGAGTIHAQPYHGQSKPIERFFGTLETRFVPTFESYCGNSPKNRPENLDAKLARGKGPTLADFSAAFDEWLRVDYHGREHAGDGVDGQTPDVAFAKNLLRKVTADKRTLDALLLRREKPVTVTQNGVLYKGLRYGQYSPELTINWLGKKVVLAIDDRDLSHVQVWSEDDRFICVADSNRRVAANATDEDLRTAIAEKRRHSKLNKEFYEKRPRMFEDTTDLLLRATAARNAAKPPESPIDPPALVPLRTAIEDQMKPLERAVEFFKGGRATGTDGPIAPFAKGYDAFRDLAKAFERDKPEFEPIADPFEILSSRNQWGEPMEDAEEKSQTELLREWSSRLEEETP